MIGGMQVAKAARQKPVVIEVMKLDHELAHGRRALALQRARRESQVFSAAPVEVLESEQVRRIKEINRALNGKSLAELKLRGSPIAVLIDRGKIKGEELTAAQDIELAFFALSSRLMIRPMNHDRVDGGGAAEEWPVKTAQAVGRYQAWARHWSIRAKRGDRTLEIVIAALIDQRALSTIEADIGLRHGKAAQVLARALRDYAARAGWASPRDAAMWKAQASSSFLRRGAA